MTTIAPNKIYLVVAGCFQEFKHWCINHRFYMTGGEYKSWPNGTGVSKAIYISLRESLHGRVRENVELVFVGTYHFNPLYGSLEFREFQQQLDFMNCLEEEQEELPKIRFIRV